MRFRDLLHPFHQHGLVDRIDLDPEAILRDRVEQLVQAPRQVFGELLQLEQSGEELAGRKALEHAFAHDSDA